MWLYGRLVGIVCVLAACILAGLELEQRLKRRWLFCREMAELLQFMEQEMVYHRAPLPEALAEAARRSRDGVQALFGQAARLVRAQKDGTFQALWIEAVADSGISRLLDEEQRREVQSLSAALCNADTVMQRTLLEKYRDRFWGMSRDAEQQYREKGSLQRRLMTAVGVFLVLLLI